MHLKGRLKIAAIFRIFVSVNKVIIGRDNGVSPIQSEAILAFCYMHHWEQILLKFEFMIIKETEFGNIARKK